MSGVLLVTIILLVLIIVVLLIYNMSIHKKIDNLNTVNQQVMNLRVLQDFMDTIGESYISVDEKITRINETLIEKYNIKYSTIVIFDGAEYVIKASNVEEKHWDALKDLYNEEMFKESIETATPKYVTVNKSSERLPYQKMEFGRAKSAMFFPLYIDNVYIGYWIIESAEIHAFDKLDTAVIEVVKDNIISVIKTLEKQSTIENIVRKDEFSGLQSAEYLYGKGKNIIDKYTVSTVCMFRITNIEKVNEEISRETGNKIITKISEFINNSISDEYVFVRYMGPKFIIVFSGVEPEGTVDFLTDLKKNVEKLKVYKNSEDDIEIDESDEETKNKKVFAKPRLNIVITSYYKGTSIDELAKRLEEYIDNADEEESNINYI